MLHFLLGSFHPLFYFTLGLINGICFIYEPFCALTCSLFLIPLSLALFIKVEKKELIIPYIALIGGILIGFLRGYYQQNSHSFKYYNSPIDIIGSVTNISNTNHRFFHSSITLEIEKIKYSSEEQWQNYKAKITLYTRKNSDIEISDTLEIKNIICKEINNEEFKKHQIKEGIKATSFIDSLNYLIIYRPNISIKRYLYNIHNKLMLSLYTKLNKQTKSIFSTIFLGDRSNKKQIEKTSFYFKQWGIVHQLARSGLHLVIFVGCWYSILRFIPISFILKQIILIILSLLYCLFSFSSISFIRALSTFFFHKICTLLHLQTDLFHILTIVACSIILLNPIQIFFLDFQLSFTLTFGLIWIHNYINEKIKIIDS